MSRHQALQAHVVEECANQLCCSSVATLLQLCCSSRRQALQVHVVEEEESSDLLQLCCSLNLQHLLSFESALLQLCCRCYRSVAALMQQLSSFPRSCHAHLLTIE